MSAGNYFKTTCDFDSLGNQHSRGTAIHFDPNQVELRSNIMKESEITELISCWRRRVVSSPYRNSNYATHTEARWLSRLTRFNDCKLDYSPSGRWREGKGRLLNEGIGREDGWTVLSIGDLICDQVGIRSRARNKGKEFFLLLLLSIHPSILLFNDENNWFKQLTPQIEMQRENNWSDTWTVGFQA